MKHIGYALLLVVLGIIIGGIVVNLVHPSSSHAQKVVFTEQAPKPIGHYSQAISTGTFVFTSGQIGIDPATGNISESVEGQTEQVMKNLQAILAVSGHDFSDVIQARIYLTNITDFPAVNSIYETYLKNSSPARSTVQVAGLPKGAKVEIEMIALE